MSQFQIIFFDDSFRSAFKPLTFTRPVCDLRIGILTIREKWERYLKSGSTTSTETYLEKWNYAFLPDATLQHIWINSRAVPNPGLAAEVVGLKEGEAIIKGDTVIAFHCGNNIARFNAERKDHLSEDFSVIVSKVHSEIIHRISDIFTLNGAQINADLDLMNAKSETTLSASNRQFGSFPVILAKGAKAEACIFNTTHGPIYIGENAEVMEGAMLRGPVAICAGTQVKMGAKIYGDTTIGPGCKVGGEITNSLFYANSNKAHDGYVGNSVIGEWCNLGADTNTSNLKNTYGEVSVYNYAIDAVDNTGLQFHGLVMGDHAKCGINTMFNTGTVAGVCSNIYGGGFPEKFIPDFSWGGFDGFVEFRFEKATEMIRNVYKRRNKELSEGEVEVLRHIFKETAAKRKF